MGQARRLWKGVGDGLLLGAPFPVATEWPRFEGGGSRPEHARIVLFSQADKPALVGNERTERFGLQS